jgi:hypothetical protein
MLNFNKKCCSLKIVFSLNNLILILLRVMRSELRIEDRINGC